MSPHARMLGLVGMMYLTPFNVYAWEEVTHRNLTSAAISASAMRYENTYSQIGVADSNALFPNTDGWWRNSSDATLRELMENGGAIEDDDARALNHFFDPATGQPLTRGDVIPDTAPDWALEDKGDITHSPLGGSQEYSLKDAGDYLYRAVTDADYEQRRRHYSLLFRSLGQVVPVLQDMSQPLHLRDDANLCLRGRQRPELT